MSRIGQFIRDVAAPVLPLEVAFFRSFLSDDEEELFRKLRRAEMRHSIRVTRLTLENLSDDLGAEEQVAVARAVLLHDIGKIRHAMGPFTKTFMVIFKKNLTTPGSSLAKTKAGDIYLNHPEYSWQLLKERGSFKENPYLYDLVRWHHEPEHFLHQYEGHERRVFLAFSKADDVS